MSHIPPPVVPPPLTLEYATPSTGLKVRAVGLAQRQIMWVILFSILVTVRSAIQPFAMTLTRGAPPTRSFWIIVAVSGILRIVMIVLMMIGVYRLTAALKMGMTARVPFLLGMLIGLLNLILLLIINQKATKLLRQYASEVATRILDAVEQLVQFPLSGAIVPDTEDPGIRQILVYRYRIIYRIRSDSAQIVRIIHGARDLKGMIDRAEF